MEPGSYFRPDDYYGCYQRECIARPWVLAVKRKWASAFLAHQLKFRNPYDSLKVDEYRSLQTHPK